MSRCRGLVYARSKKKQKKQEEAAEAEDSNKSPEWSVVGWERGLVRLRLVVHNSTICHFVFKYFLFIHMSVPVCPRECVLCVCVVSSLLSTDCDICISIDSSAGDDECWTLARARMKNRLHSRSHSHWYSHSRSHSHAVAAAAAAAAVGWCCCCCCSLWLFHTFHRLISLGGAAN